MKRSILVALSLAVFSGACAAPGGDAERSAAAPETPAPAASPTPTPAEPVVRRNAADAFSGASALDATGRPAATPANPAGETNAATPGSASGTAQATATKQDGPQIPAGANWTIFCQEFTGTNHVPASTEMKRILSSTTKLKDWYVIHEEGRSVLYCGYYRYISADNLPATASTSDRAEVDRAQSDKAQLEKIPSPLARDRKLFPMSVFVSLDSPDPDAPAEWNLENAKGFWSVQIAAYNTPDRKQAAVDSVREARKAGVEAYYFHGKDGVSCVTIGSWPEAAVRRPAFMADAGREGVDMGADERRGVFLDLGDQPGDPAKWGINRNEVRVMRPKIEITDPSLSQTLKEYPVHHVNGFEQPIPGQPGAFRASLLVRVPGKTANGSSAVGSDSTGDDAGGGQNDARQRSQLQQRLQGIGR